MSYGPNQPPRVFRFAPYEVDRQRFQLTRAGYRIELPRIAMEVLLLLVEHEGALVTRSELVRIVWPGIDPEQKEQSVNTAINRIRSALRDDPARPRYIETVIGKGYRFIAPLEAAPADQPDIKPSFNPLASTPDSDPQPESFSADTAVDPLPPQQSATRSRTIPWPLTASVGIVLTLSAVFAWRSTRSTGDSSNPFQDFKLATPTPFTANYSDNHVIAAAISPDAAHIALADAEGIKVVATRDATPLPLASVPLRLIDRIAWFPEGDRLLVSGIGISSELPEIWMASRSAATPPRLFRANAQSASVSADGSRVLYLSAGRQELWDAASDGSAPKLLLGGSPGEEFIYPTWFPDGKLILLQRRSQPTESSRLLHPNAPDRNVVAGTLVLREGDAAILTTLSPFKMASPCIFPDGAVLAITDTVPGQPLTLLGVDLHTGRLLSPPRALPTPPGYNVGGVSAAPNGRVALLLQAGSAGVFAATLSNSGRTLEGAHPLGSPRLAAFPHAWTPDSRHVLFEQGAHGRWQLMQQDIARHDAEPLTGAPVEGVMPRLSPDHRWLLFYRKIQDDEPLQLFRLPYPTQAGAEPELLSVPPGEFRCPAVGAECILRVKNAAQRQVIFLSLDPATGRTHSLRLLPWADNSFGDWDVSPNGREVVLVAGPNQPGEIRILSLSTSREQILHFPLGASFAAVNWQVTGKGWFASVDAGAGATLYALQPDGKAIPLRDTLTSTWAVPSPDGKAIAYVDLNQDRNVWLTRREFLLHGQHAP